MSLFGGDSNRASPPSNSEQSPLAPTRSSPTQEAQKQPHGAQHARSHDFTTDTNAQDDFLSDSELESVGNEEKETARPNRFKGKAITWQRYTSPDRRIAASLDQIRDTDLSAHLYNVHALKRRVRLPAEELADMKPWQSREHWQKKGSALQYEDIPGEIQSHLVPVKDWTAWPLPPDQLPSVKGSRQKYVSAIGSVGHEAGDVMREELLATFVRIAKENWNARASVPKDARGRTADGPSRSRSRSKRAWSARSQRSVSRNDVYMKSGDELEKTQDGEDQKIKVTGTTGIQDRQPAEALMPAMMADDAKAYNILRPTIQSTLTQFDRLVLAIRRTRLNHLGHGAYGDISSPSEFTSGAESSGPASRPHSGSKPRTSKGGTPRSRAHSRADSTNSVLRPNPARNRATHCTVAQRLADSDSGSSAQLPLRKQSRSASAPTDASSRDGTHRLGLIDWSEILGLASMTDWDEDAVTRTAQRCATLFGESMSFVALPEDSASLPILQPVEYIPSTVPPPLLYEPQIKRPCFHPGTLRCPHEDCHRHEEDFKEPYRVIEHCMRVHNYDPRTNDSDNEERRVGAVHIDGFGREVVARHGRKGRTVGVSKDRQRRVKKMKAEDKEHDDDD